MTTSDVQPAAPQPGAPGNEWATPPVQEEKKSGAKKWAALAGTVAVVGVGAAYSLTGGFGIGDPKVGDCVQMAGETDFEAVACDDRRGRAEDRRHRRAGDDPQPSSTRPASRTSAPTSRPPRPPSGSATSMTEPGTIYCAASI